MINMAYCCLILLGKLIQKVVFGKLRVIEHQVLTLATIQPVDSTQSGCELVIRDRELLFYYNHEDWQAFSSTM